MTDLKIVKVPNEFCFQDPFFYPSDNEVDFEYWLSLNVKEEDIQGEKIYLPITWTAYYKRHGYGSNKEALDKLQLFLNGLDKTKKYFSVIQYDSGCLNDLKGLDIKIFSMAGQPMDYPLPLICQPHKYVPVNTARDIQVCFVGADTHPIRTEIFNLYMGRKDWLIENGKMPLNRYCSTLAHSVFSLCPRGYSGNSFRIQESLQYGAIPCVISDDFHEPHYEGFGQYGIIISPMHVQYIPLILSTLPPSVVSWKQRMGKIAYQEFYTFESNRKLILKNLES